MADKKFLIGCVADDFTGAGDAASFLAENGVKTILTNGIPEASSFGGDFDAIVIALKSRTQEKVSAVRDTLEAFDRLKEAGAKTLYFKYCSTFDSTADGNIGPVIDAVLRKYDIPYTVICPSLLPNGRTVKDGILYVNGVPLAESHMRNHPLTPMTESDISKLMNPQGKYPCFKIGIEDLNNRQALNEKIARYTAENEHFYLCLDYYEESHGPKIAEIFSQLPFLTGGSGLIGELAKHSANADKQNEDITGEKSPRIIFAGSCSAATQGQVKSWINSGKKSLMVFPEKLRDGTQSEDCIWEFITEHREEDLLIYSSGSGGSDTTSGSEGDAELLENTLAALAKRSRDNGYTKIISAGGETSGAITKALGYSAFYIGQSAAPGVPVMSPIENPELQIVLKSGNFGGPDFFLTTLI